MGTTRRLAELTWPRIERRAPVVLVPVGSCEQHGPHLPLGTDTMVAEVITERAAGILDDEGHDVVIAPSLAMTASGEHAGFPGTLSVGTQVMEEIVVELIRSADWAHAVVLVNGHGGNHRAVTAAARRVSAEGRRVLAWWPRVPGGDLHAGRIETSLVLALAPHLVRAPLPPAAGHDVSVDDLRRNGVRALSPSGVLGDPSQASVEEGRRIVDDLVDDLVAAATSLVSPDGRSETGA